MLRLGEVRLRDGRRLAYSERGRPGGRPVIHQHGMPGSRLEDFGADQVLDRLGIRLITPDRPGYGSSDPHPGRTPETWAEDVLDLAGRLGIGRFAVTSLSGGGPYALALAAAAPDRIISVALASSPAPMQWRGASRGMRFLSRAGLWLGAHAPLLLSAVVAVAARVASSWPALVVAQVRRKLSASDRRWLALPSVRAGEVDNLLEAFRLGGLGYAQDVTILARPWHQALGRIASPVRLWHGGADSVVPIAHARLLAAMVPGAELVECRDEGHMLMWNHIQEMLEWSVDPMVPDKTGRRPYRQAAAGVMTEPS